MCSAGRSGGLPAPPPLSAKGIDVPRPGSVELEAETLIEHARRVPQRDGEPGESHVLAAQHRQAADGQVGTETPPAPGRDHTDLINPLSGHDDIACWHAVPVERDPAVVGAKLGVGRQGRMSSAAVSENPDAPRTRAGRP